MNTIEENEKLAAYLAETIFELGDDGDSPCTRIEFKGKNHRGIEIPQGGVIKSALTRWISMRLEEYDL